MAEGEKLKFDYSSATKNEFEDEKAFPLLALKFKEDEEHFRVLFQISTALHALDIGKKIIVHTAICDLANIIFNEIKLQSFQGTEQ